MITKRTIDALRTHLANNATDPATLARTGQLYEAAARRDRTWPAEPDDPEAPFRRGTVLLLMSDACLCLAGAAWNRRQRPWDASRIADLENRADNYLMGALRRVEPVACIDFQDG